MQGTSESVLSISDSAVHDLRVRVTRIEHETRFHNTELAVLKNDIAYVKDEVGGISRGINKILWAISLSVLGAIMTFILTGGLILNQ